MRAIVRSIMPPCIFIPLGMRPLYPCSFRSAQSCPGRFVYRTNAHTLSANLRLENRPPTDCGDTHRWRNKGSVRTIMNQELQRIENKKVGRSQTRSDGFIGSRNSIVNGRTFQTDVVGSGASAALASDSPRAINSLRDLSLLQVQDTLTKLHKLAPSYRRHRCPQRPFSSRSYRLRGGKPILAQPGPFFVNTNFKQMWSEPGHQRR